MNLKQSLLFLLFNTSGTSVGFSLNAPLSTLSSSIVAKTPGGRKTCRNQHVVSFVHNNAANSKQEKISTQLYSSAQDTSTSALDDLSIVLNGPDLPPVPLTSKRLFMVRHGEVINPGGDRPVYYGSQDVTLSPLGELEAKAAGSYLKQFELQNVAASPLTRAIFGAKEVLKRQMESDRDVKILQGFTEMDRGEWAGKTIEEIGRDIMDRFDACDESVTPQGGESYPELKKRVLEARDELLAMTDNGRASAVVSHLQVTRCMLSDALGIPVNQMSKLKVATASVTCVDYDTVTGEQQVHFQSFKPEAGLQKSGDGAN